MLDGKIVIVLRRSIAVFTLLALSIMMITIILVGLYPILIFLTVVVSFTTAIAVVAAAAASSTTTTTTMISGMERTKAQEQRRG